MFEKDNFQKLVHRALVDWNLNLNQLSQFLHETVFPGTKFEPWDIPRKEDLLALERSLGIATGEKRRMTLLTTQGFSDEPILNMRAFSATSLFIRFLIFAWMCEKIGVPGNLTSTLALPPRLFMLPTCFRRSGRRTQNYMSSERRICHAHVTFQLRFHKTL